MNETVFLIFGLSLAALALIVTVVGMRAKSFPNRPAMIGVILLFCVLVAGTATFAVRLSREEAAHREAHEHEAAPGEEDEPALGSAPGVRVQLPA